MKTRPDRILPTIVMIFFVEPSMQRSEFPTNIARVQFTCIYWGLYDLYGEHVHIVARSQIITRNYVSDATSTAQIEIQEHLKDEKLQLSPILLKAINLVEYRFVSPDPTNT